MSYQRKKLSGHTEIAPYFFILPCVLFLLVFIYYPLIRNFWNSFYAYSGLSGKRSFLGLANYAELFTDEIMLTALVNCFKYAAISVLFQVLFGLILAAILEDETFRSVSKLFRTVFFIPVIISLSVICLLFGFIYNPRYGLLNTFLKIIGFGHLAKAWLGRSDTAIYATIAVSQWQSIGYIMMLFIVDIQKIPQDLYDAANIDGAGKIRKFISITVPHVREMFFVAMIVTVTGSMMVFSEPYIMTSGGGPGFSSITMSVYMYQLGFVRDDMGLASTVAIVIFSLSVLLALLQALTLHTGKEE